MTLAIRVTVPDAQPAVPPSEALQPGLHRADHMVEGLLDLQFGITATVDDVAVDHHEVRLLRVKRPPGRGPRRPPAAWILMTGPLASLVWMTA
jgi:hypothetical protein